MGPQSMGFVSPNTSNLIKEFLMIRFPTVTQPEAIKFLQRARMHAVSLTLITNGTRQLLCANGRRAPSYSGASVDCCRRLNFEPLNLCKHFTGGALHPGCECSNCLHFSGGV